MKNIICKGTGAFLLTAALTISQISPAQNVEVTRITTTSQGTVSEFGPQAILIRTDEGAQPVRYVSSETTHYVDEEGNPLTATMVKSGLPVTIYQGR